MRNGKDTLTFIVFLLCLAAMFGFVLYKMYLDYEAYKKQEGLKKLTRKVSKGFKQIGKTAKQVGKTIVSVKTIFKLLKCPINIFSNLQKCAKYYYQDKLFELIWLIVWVINFVIIYIPVFILDKMVCFTFNKCFNISPTDVCLSKKTFVKFIENLYFLTSGGGRFLHRNPSDVRKCYCTPPVVYLFDPLRKFTSYFDTVVKDTPNYTALIIPIGIFGILAYSQR